MHNIYAFAENLEYIDNTGKNSVSPVGEMSPISKTFSSDIRSYEGSSDLESKINLQVLSIIDKTTSENIPMEMDEHRINVMTTVVDWVFANSDGGIGLSASDFNSDINNEITLPDVTINADLIVSRKVGETTRNIPIYVEIVDSSLENEFMATIWLCDEFFGYDSTSNYRTYDRYEIVVSDFTPNVDIFLGTAEDIEAYYTPLVGPALLDDITKLEDGTPATWKSMEKHTWYNPSNSAEFFDNITIPFIVYGKKPMEEPELTITAIKDYILENSEQGIEVWKNIFPTIFVGETFTIIPFWDTVAFNNGFVNIYGAGIKTDAIKNYYAFIPEFDEEYLNSYSDLMLSNYQELKFISVGDDTNVGTRSLLEKYPDVISLPATDQDFERMSQETKNFVSLTNLLLSEAEIYKNDGNYVPPSNVKVLDKVGRKYLLGISGNTQYEVMTKQTFEIFGEQL